MICKYSLRGVDKTLSLTELSQVEVKVLMFLIPKIRQPLPFIKCQKNERKTRFILETGNIRYVDNYVN